MREDVLLSHLTKSEFSPMQAETLPRILSEMATREYMDAHFATVNGRFERALGNEIARIEKTFGSEIARVDRTVGSSISRVERTLGTEIAHLDRKLGIVNEHLEKTAT